MWRLLLVSVIWACSFGLIKAELTTLPPLFVAAVRLLLCLLAFLPVLFWAKKIKVDTRLMGLGVIQFGLMYMLYIYSYQYLPAYMVAVFTIFTPLYVLAIDATFQRQWQAKLLPAALLSILGAAIIVFKMPEQGGILTGFLLVQGANLAFALGQVAYRHLHCDQSDGQNMLWMYLGASLFAVSVLFSQLEVSIISPTVRQWWVLLYLGVVASGLGFYLWNSGAKQVNAGVLAVMNNGYVPLAVVIAITLFAEQRNLLTLLLGSTLIGTGLLLAHYQTNSGNKAQHIIK